MSAAAASSSTAVVAAATRSGVAPLPFQASALIADGDFVLVFLQQGKLDPLTIKAGGIFQCKQGAFYHDDMIGQPYGGKVCTRRGGRYVTILAPSPELWTLALPHRTQILYIQDISMICTWMDLQPGRRVAEAGTGSGSLSTAISRCIAPTGQLYTFEFNADRAAAALKDFKTLGLETVVTGAHRDVCEDGFGDIDELDGIFLDLPAPWLAVPAVHKTLRDDGVFVSFSPCIEQVQRCCDALRESGGFADIRTYEVLQREYHVQTMENTECPSAIAEVMAARAGVKLGAEVSAEEGTAAKKRKVGDSGAAKAKEDQIICSRPELEAKGHTGYLTYTRKCVAMPAEE